MQPGYVPSGPERSRSPAVSAARYALLFLLLPFLGLLAFLGVRQQHLIFDAYSEVVAFPADLGLPYEEVRLQTPDGEILRVWWMGGGNPGGPVVLGFGGNAMRLDGQAESLAEWIDLIRAAVAFEYRGYGASTGTPGEQGFYLDARTVYDWMVAEKGVDPDELVLWGHSLGAAVAVELAQQRPVAGLVLRGAFTSLARVGSDHYHLPQWLVGWVSRHDFESARKLRARPPEVPVLLIHGRKDNIIGHDHAEDLAEILGGRATLVSHDGGHNNWGRDFPAERRREVVAGFFDEVLSK